MTPPIRLDSPIVMQHPDNPCNWILVKPFPIDEGIIPHGFVTDFASIPRFFWRFITPTELGDKGPISHDWRYRNGIGTREEADKLFLRDMKDDGIGWWRRTAAYRAVRMFGGPSWNTGKVVIEELAPC